MLADMECHLIMAGMESPATVAHMAWARALLEASGVSPHTEMIPGHADQVIADYVHERNMDLVVMGAYGHSRVRQLMVGSTTTTMIRSCLVPILLVR
jgi:nucleotide-binding universal stress UspA family protein